MGKKSKKPSKQAPKPKAAPAVPPAQAVPLESAQIYSAHKTISVYQGTEDGVATFGVATYLRYAKADASKAEEPRHDLSLPLAEADAHTALLSESAEGAISSVVASLTAGDRVELEWLQMRLPGAAFDSEPVRVCPKLARVTEAEEKALIEQWCQKVPAPGLVSGVPRPAPICAPCKPAKPPPRAAAEPPAPPAPR